MLDRTQVQEREKERCLLWQLHDGALLQMEHVLRERLELLEPRVREVRVRARLRTHELLRGVHFPLQRGAI